MRRSFRFVPVLFILILGLSACPGKGKGPSPANAPQNTPVDAVKAFFDSVYNQKYDVAWNNLSTVSQNKIVQLVAEEEKLDNAKVKKLFDDNDPAIQKGFWNAFRDSSKVASFVPTAQYQLVSENGNQAVVKMTAGEVQLENKVVKESNGWRMGYVETFMADEVK